MEKTKTPWTWDSKVTKKGERIIEVEVWEGSRERMPPWDQDAELANNPGESNLLHILRWLLERD
ncbi:hypothetical protein COLO4_04886 [Corchorus olitorius]|uniref:Uncharacterized protein n=1 Tax=Corchorus olitorius TaxID=93759 RepID=A0A1R3KSI7_9ROSI|nr:hypothetical protein COLO4_04886 [Corchorus olitorius]